MIYILPLIIYRLHFTTPHLVACAASLSLSFLRLRIVGKLPYASLRSRLGKAVDKGRFDAMALSRRYWPQRIERTGLKHRYASLRSHLSESRRQPRKDATRDDDRVSLTPRFARV